MQKFFKYIFLTTFIFTSCREKDEATRDAGRLQLVSVLVGTSLVYFERPNRDFPVDKPIVVTFTAPLNPSTASAISLSTGTTDIPVQISFLNNNRTFSALPSTNLENNQEYTLSILPTLKGENGEAFPGITVNFSTVAGKLEVVSFFINGKEVTGNDKVQGVRLSFLAELNFSKPVNPTDVTTQNISVTGSSVPGLSFSLSNENKKLLIRATDTLLHFEKYSFIISQGIKGLNGEVFPGFSKEFLTVLDSSPKFPIVSDGELLTAVQRQTFKYFWDFAHPSSGMARERNTSGEVVASGGSGFGLMAILVGIERNFITRDEGLSRLIKIVNFLKSAERFHGAWPHWLNGSTGKVYPFSADDDGGDLVETSFLVQGLITVREYLNPLAQNEKELIEAINELVSTVEWSWYTKGEDVLYWHWSPRVGWKMNMAVRGYNETLITYLLAASSPNFPVNRSVYTNGWARNGAIVNGKTFQNYRLPLGTDLGGPLFFAHYSFLGLDPRNLADTYANYWEQNLNHSLINRAYAIENPRGFYGYSEDLWGITASDNRTGYAAHSPTNDLGVIAPTAAISSIPYTPEYSLEVIRFLYYTLGDKMWGPYGFYDALNPSEGWYAKSYLAIDQGPQIIMIENYRTQLLWNLFMKAPEVQAGLDELGFSY